MELLIFHGVTCNYKDKPSIGLMCRLVSLKIQNTSKIQRIQPHHPRLVTLKKFTFFNEEIIPDHTRLPSARVL